MIKNIWKIAVRNLWKHKSFSFINLLGLAIGMAAFFLIFLYVSHELGYNKFNAKADRIYRVVTYAKTPSEDHYFGAAPAMGPAMQRDFPMVKAVVRMQPIGLLVENGNIKFQEDHILVADSTLFSIFSFPLIKGDPDKALADPFSVVLSESAARKYFGKEDPVGKVLTMDRQFLLRVTGVMRDIPENSSVRSDIIVSMTSVSRKLDPQYDQQWNSFEGHTYLLLAPGAHADQLQTQLPAFVHKYTANSVEKAGIHFTLSLERLQDVYLHSKYSNGTESGNLSNVYIFSVIGIFLLAIAVINFVNLTTARSAERAKEVAVKKVVGSSKGLLAAQFLGESLLLSLLSFLFATLFCGLLIPVFNYLAGKPISNGIFEHWWSVPMLFALALFIGIVAGSYPAWVLSSFNPLEVLRGKLTSGKKGTLIRQVLVVLQFVISIVLIVSTLVVYVQLTFMRGQALGFKKDQMLVIDFHGDQNVVRRIDGIKDGLSGVPGVVSVSASSGIPANGNTNILVQMENSNGVMQTTGLDAFFVDEDFLRQYQIKLLAGRLFSKDFRGDRFNSMIVNRAALTQLGYKEPAQIIGKRFRQDTVGTVVGVVENFHYRSLTEKIRPLVFRIDTTTFGVVTLNVRGQDIPVTVKAIEERWKTLVPERPISYYFLDEAFAKTYRDDVRFGELVLYFSMLVIFISCLGLSGLAMFSTNRRTREIGIRKALGSSIPGIVTLLTKEFVRLIVIAFVIASPIAWIAMQKWLEGFAYRISMNFFYLLGAGLIALFVALATVSFRAIKAARVNPIDSLKTS